MKKEQRNRKVIERSTEPAGPKRPQAPDASADEVWSRVQLLVAAEKASETPGPAEPAEPKPRKRGAARRRRRLRRRIVLFDWIAVTVWTFVFVKLFVADVDRFLVGVVAPELLWLLDLRIVIALLLLAMVLLLFKARSIAGAVAYVTAYPLVVLCWKIPRFVVERRGFGRKGMWVVAAVVNAIAAWIARGKWIMLALSIVTVSALVILLSHSPLAIYSAACAMILTLGWSLAVRTVDMLRSPQFIRTQQRAIGWILDSKLFDQFVTPKHPDKLALKDWTLDDAKAYRDNAGNAVLLHRGLWFWAYAIDQYRRGPALVIRNIAAIFIVLAQVIFVFTFVNAGIFEADPAQFHTTVTPAWWTWVNYSATALTFGEISAVTPVGILATVAKVVNGVIGDIGILTILVTLVIGFLSARTDHAAESAVKMLTKKVEQIEKLSVDEYKSDIDALESYLTRAAWGLHLVSEWILARLPAEWRHGR